MSKVREGTLAPMDSPQYHDEVGDLIDTYNYMTRKMGDMVEDQLKAAEELRMRNLITAGTDQSPFLYIRWI